jgi:uncharacterized protein (TIGR03435 family)
MRACAACSLIALLTAAAFGQPAETAPKFEVADIHSSPRTQNPGVRGPFFSGGRYEVRFATMVDLISMAYNMDPEKVYGGPSWLELDRFDVFAKISAGSTAESRRRMLQSLLADRFHLVSHTDKKPMSALALTAGKHPEMKEASGDEAGSCNFNIQNQPNGPPTPGTPIQLPTIIYTCKNTTMEAFAAAIPTIPAAGQYLNNLLVTDQTGIKGSWDFSLHFTPKLPAGIQTIGENIPLADALDRQLGLKLEMSTAPMPVMAVDSVDRKPTENSPEAMKSFPPLPTEFEVASLKPSAPVTGGEGPRPSIKNGRVFLPRFSVKNLIQISWELNGDEFLVNAPSWLDNDRYDILAKAPDDVAIGDLTPSRTAIPVNIDALRPMLKSLVTERFKIKAHIEERPLNAYTLVAAKPKLKQSDPSSRIKWQNGVISEAKAGKNANQALGRLVSCQNVTMAQFAQMLPDIAPGYLRTDVIDATGLEGGYDFTFSFSPAGALQFSQGPKSESEEASDPSGVMSLFDALTRQLGLKLEQHKRPAKVLVIDSIERTPAEN